MMELSAYDAVCAIAPASPPHTSFAGKMSTSPQDALCVPSVSGNFSKAKFFSISKLQNERPVPGRKSRLFSNKYTDL